MGKIESIIVVYEDGNREFISREDCDKLESRCERDKKNVLETFHELLLMTDLDYLNYKHQQDITDLKIYNTKVLARQAQGFQIRLQNLKERTQQKSELIYKKKHIDSLNKQRGIIVGSQEEKKFPYCAEYPYDINDTIAVFDTYDYEVLRGRSNGAINCIVKQELKTGRTYKYLDSRQRQLKELINSINDPRIKFEHWGKEGIDDSWHIIL